MRDAGPDAAQLHPTLLDARLKPSTGRCLCIVQVDMGILILLMMMMIMMIIDVIKHGD